MRLAANTARPATLLLVYIGCNVIFAVIVECVLLAAAPPESVAYQYPEGWSFSCDLFLFVGGFFGVSAILFVAKIYWSNDAIDDASVHNTYVTRADNTHGSRVIPPAWLALAIFCMGGANYVFM